MHDNEPSATPGWYADPWAEAPLRYWDGSEWTGHTHAEATPAPTLDQTIFGGAKTAWSHTVAASKRARDAAAPTVSAASAKSRQIWDSASTTVKNELRSKPTEHEQAEPQQTAPQQAPPLPTVVPATAPQQAAPQQPAPQQTVPPRPLTHRIAMAAWALAGLLSVATPLIVVAILNSQYQRVKRLVLLADPGLIEEYIDQTELAVSDFTSGPFQIVATIFITVGVLMLLIYSAVVCGVFVGSNIARIAGTILVVLATPVLLGTAFLGTWLTGMLAWVNIGALAFVNISFPIVILLHIAGAVCVWLPPTNRYVRARRQLRESRRTAAGQA